MLPQPLEIARIIARGLTSPPRAVSRLNYRVGVSDSDMNRHLTNSRYFNYMDLGRWDWLMRSGLLKSALLNEGVRPMVVDIHIQYKRELPFMAGFTLDTRCVGREGKTLLVEQHFLRGDKVHTRAELKILTVAKGKVIDPAPLMSLVTAPLQIRDWQVVGGKTT